MIKLALVLLVLVFVYLPFANGREIDLGDENQLMDMLTAAFSDGFKGDRVETLREKFKIDLTLEEQGRFVEMSNLGVSLARNNYDRGLEQGILQGRELGMQQGMQQGMVELNLLNTYLIEQNRFDDLARGSKDPIYQQQLIIELAPYYKK